MNEHDSTFVINDIHLSVSPENISINKSAQLLQKKPLRVRGSAKMRSPSTIVSIDVNVKFEGASEINSKLMPLIAQFKLMPFCRIQNQFIKDSLIGSENIDQNLAFALNNLNISTVPDHPLLWNVTFSFVWFNYNPYSKDFRFKTRLFSKSKIDRSLDPGAVSDPDEDMSPFQLFYSNELSKLSPVFLLNSNFEAGMLEFILAPEAPVTVGATTEVEVNFSKLKDLEHALEEFVSVTDAILETASTDALGSISPKEMLARLSGGTSPADIAEVLFQSDSAIRNLKTNAPNNALLSSAIKIQEQITKLAPAIFDGKVWLEFPVSDLGPDIAGERRINQVRGMRQGKVESVSKLYYRTVSIGTSSENFSSGIVATSINVNFGHKLAMIPMQGYNYPTMQHIGSDDVYFTVSFACLDDFSNRSFTDFWNTAQKNLLVNKLVPQDLLGVSIKNEIFQFFGVKDTLIQEANLSTVPQQPGLYTHNFSFVENQFRISETEQFVSIPTSFRPIKKAIWAAIWDNLTPQWLNSIAGITNLKYKFNMIPSAENEASLEFLQKLLARGEIIDSSFASDSMNQQIPALLGKLGEKSREDISTPNSILSLLPGITDDEVLGIEGLSDVVQKLAPEFNNNSDKYGYFNLLPGTKYNSNRVLSKQEARSRFLLQNERKKERLAVMTSALAEFSELKSTLAEKDNFSIDNDLIIRTSDGRTIDFKKSIQDPVLIAVVKDRMNTPTNFITEGIASLEANSDHPFFNNGSNFSLSKSIARDKFFAAMSDIENELNGVKDKTGEGPFTVFEEWNLWANAVAQKVIDEYLNLPIFAEARKLQDEMERKTRRCLYPDMRFNEIEQLVMEKASVAGVLPEDIDLEPDFFFWNESIDNPEGTQLDEIAMATIKQNTNDYYQAVFRDSKDWYNKKYLNKVNPEFQKFLKMSHETGEDGPSTSSAITTVSSGRQQITQETIPKSGNAYLNKNGKLAGISDSLQKSFNNNQIRTGINAPVDSNNIPVPIMRPTSNEQSMVSTQSETSTDVLDASIGMSTVSIEEQSAFSGWIHPLPGATITSKVGFRTHPTHGTISFHRGTDLAYGSRALTQGQPVRACLAGIIVAAGHGDGEGIFVNIESEYADRDFSSLIHRYYHLQGIGIKSDATQWKVGDTIKAGEILGFVGNTGIGTGPHLHFEVQAGNLDKTFIYPFGYESNFLRETNDEQKSLGFKILKRPDFIPYTGVSNPALPRTAYGEVNSISSFEMSTQKMKIEQQRVAGYRMNRAFPTIYLAFIEEDLQTEYIHKFDDYFSFSSIVNLYMVRDREVPADYAAMELTNLSGILSNRRYRGTFNETNAISNGREARDADRRDGKMDTEEEFKFESMVLREGIKVEIRLGYSNNPDQNEIVFIGRIAGVEFSESDDVVFVEMQSLATELVQDIKGESEIETKDGWFTSDARTGPLLEEMIASPECVSFGYWERGQKEGNGNRDLLTNRFTWNPQPSTDNIFAPLSDDLDDGKIFLGSTVIEKVLFGTVSAAAIGVATAGLLGGSLVVGAFGSVFGSGGALVIGGASLTSIFGESVEEILNLKAPFSNLKYYLYQTTIWDVFKEMEHRHPDCISSPVPYVEKLGGRTRMTMFFGNPDWLYFAKDPSASANRKSSEIKARRQELTDAMNSGSSEDSIKRLREFSDSLDSEEFKTIENSVKEALGNKDVASAEKLIGDLNKIVKQKQLDDAINESAIRPFRSYHLATSQQHIVSNNIRAKSSNTFNAVTIKYADDGADDTEIQNGEAIITDIEEMRMKLDPLIPDEYVREAVYTYPNCQSAHMAKRYALSHLQKACWQIYEGELVLLGNPLIKPYDIIFIYDEYTRMVGPVQVRRVVHTFDEQTGFLSVVTPDLLTTITEGAMLTELQAMGLMAEYYLGFDNVVTTNSNPAQAPQVDILKAFVGKKILGIGSFFGMKKILFLNQFGHPVRIHPLVKDGQAMVAGFGPPGVRENEFIINDLFQWVNTRSRAVSQSMTDIFHMFENREGVFNTRGTILGKVSSSISTGKVE